MSQVKREYNVGMVGSNVSSGGANITAHSMNVAIEELKKDIKAKPDWYREADGVTITESDYIIDQNGHSERSPITGTREIVTIRRGTDY